MDDKRSQVGPIRADVRPLMPRGYRSSIPYGTSTVVIRRRHPLGTNNKYIFIIVRGSKIPSEAPPRGPESTPGAHKRGPQAIPNDCRVGRNSVVFMFLAKCLHFGWVNNKIWVAPGALETL
jgi:hypothetical protein